MRKSTTQKGFTLVELAIVMTIIGLLIGGILKGQELMQNARATATIARVRAFESAVTTFRDTYSAVPGDMAGAATRLPNCDASCNPFATNAGDNIVGALAWAAGGWANQFTALTAAAATAVGAETNLFWMHLLLGDLITGVSSSPVTQAAVPAEINVTHPAAPIGGTFIAGYGQGGANIQPASTALTNQTSSPNGLLLVLALQPAAALPTATGSLPLTAIRAALIDRKMDDGRPASGAVQAYGFTASCFTVADALTSAYAEGTTGNDCGLIFRIQG